MNFHWPTLVYRDPSDKDALREDFSFFNPMGFAGHADGNSAAYCKDYPPEQYRGGSSGGQLAAKSFAVNGIGALPHHDIERPILSANEFVRRQHSRQLRGYSPGDDVGGAAFVICKLKGDILDYIIAADCFLAIIRNKSDDFDFQTGFDEAAFRVENEDNMGGFAVCLAQTKTAQKPLGDKDAAWNLYYEKYKAKRIKYSNRLIGEGGYATLNGDPELENCWKKGQYRLTPGDEVILGTDGVLWSGCNSKDHFADFVDVYKRGGIPAVLEFRDQRDYLPHIGLGKHPEGSMFTAKIA